MSYFSLLLTTTNQTFRYIFLFSSPTFPMLNLSFVTFRSPKTHYIYWIDWPYVCWFQERKEGRSHEGGHPPDVGEQSPVRARLYRQCCRVGQHVALPVPLL